MSLKQDFQWGSFRYKVFQQSCLQPLLQCAQYRLELDINYLSLWHVQHIISSKNLIPVLNISFLSLLNLIFFFYSTLSESTFPLILSLIFQLLCNDSYLHKNSYSWVSKQSLYKGKLVQDVSIQLTFRSWENVKFSKSLDSESFISYSSWVVLQDISECVTEEEEVCMIL